MNRILMLSGAMVLALVASGTASAGTQILDCYSATGRAVACATDYGNAEAALDAGRPLHLMDAQSTAPTDEQIVVVGVRPDWDAIPTDSHPATRSFRPGQGGDWVPVVATTPEDKLQQWQGNFLGGEGLSARLHF